MVDLGSAGSRYGFDLGLSEEVVESVLTEHLEAHGGAVARSTRLVGMQEDGDRVVVTLEQDGSRHDVSASWVVGCDGFHSTTRQLAGIDYPGTDLAVPWAVFDASIEGWDEAFDMNFAHFDVPPVLLCPLPDRRWRVYVHPSSESSDIVADAGTTVRRYAPAAEFVGVENPKRFRCHSPRGGPLQGGPDLRGRRRRARVLAFGGARDEHRSPGCVQPRVETRTGVSGRLRTGPARQLRGGAPPDRPAHSGLG